MKRWFTAIIEVIAASLLLAVSALATPSSLIVALPTNNSSVTSPVHFDATCTASSGTVDGWHIYVDSVDQAMPSWNGPGLNQQPSHLVQDISMSQGSHNITIKCWDTAGGEAATVSEVISVVPLSTGSTPSAGGHVVIVMLENHTYAATINQTSMPYLYSLSQKYSNATQYYAETHPSIGNYFMLTSGQRLTDDDSTTLVFDVDNITKYLQASGKSWKVYAEDLPSVGYLGGDTAGYLKHHNPFAYYSDVVNNSNLSNNIVPFPQFAQDLANGQLPNFSFVIPNSCNDAHDCSLTTADSWLRQNIDPLFQDTKTFGVDGLLMVVMDESDGTDTALGGGHTAAVIAGPKAKLGVQSQIIYQPASVLRTVCDVLGLNGCPARAQSTLGFNDMHN